MDKDKRKALQEQYKNRHKDMGIVCWKCGDRMWLAESRDIQADYNSMKFQLDLGSWPNRKLQDEYRKAADAFEWIVLKQLDYEDPAEDHYDDLDILMLEAMAEYPDAETMKPNKKWKQLKGLNCY